MKLNKKKIVIVISLAIVFALVNNCFNYLSSNLLTKEKHLEIRDETTFKTSGYWVIDPISIDGSAVGMGGHDWTWVEFQSWFGGGNGSWSNPYIFENITINGQNSTNCIVILHSNVFFIIRNCTLFNSPYNNGNGAGISLYDVNNSQIINNNCSFNNGNGIRLSYGNNNNFTGNIVSSNSVDGIYIEAAQNNTISENTINGNTYAIQSSGDSNSFIGNTVNFNDVGIDIESSNYNVISGNNINNNSFDGLSLNDCNSTIFSGNSIYNSQDGLILIGSNNNTFSNNKIYGITEIGVTLLANTGKCANNLFYNNNFTNLSGINAIDNGTNNQWDNGVIGNYWHDYTGSDKNDDGIGDTPYQITGSAGSQDNYPIWDDGPEQPKSDITIIIVIIIASVVGAVGVAVAIAIILRRRMRGEGVISKEAVEPQKPPEKPEENE